MNKYSNISKYTLVFLDDNGNELSRYSSSDKALFGFSKWGQKVDSIDDLLEILKTSLAGKCSRFTTKVTFDSLKLVADMDSAICSVNYTRLGSKNAAEPTKVEQSDFAYFVKAISDALSIDIPEPRLGARGYVGYDAEDDDL